MVRLIISISLLFFCLIANSQQYIGKKGTISFFSKAPIENISAVNKKVAAIYDARTKEIIFQLYIKDFVFPKALMQMHFNENYMESEKFPKSTFVGKVIGDKHSKKIVEGNLSIHGETNAIRVEGNLLLTEKVVKVSDVKFSVKLKDYKIKIPKIVMYNIAEEIEINVNIEMQKQ
ncbi:MAG: YceI family protein [Bacteroidota bacterium]|nr:YceI family protein [Bacteroidota bacterium]